MRLYEKGIANPDHARRIARLSKWDFLKLLAKESIPIYYDVEEPREYLEVASKLAETTKRYRIGRKRLTIVVKSDSSVITAPPRLCLDSQPPSKEYPQKGKTCKASLV